MRARFDCTDPNCIRHFTTKQGRSVHEFRMHGKKKSQSNETAAFAKRMAWKRQEAIASGADRPDQNGNELDRQEFKQAFPEMLVSAMGWTVLAVDKDRHSMIVAVPLGE